MAPVKKSQINAAKKRVTFSYGLKSFLGYLEGTQKSLHTSKSYRLDLLSFDAFLRSRSRSGEYRLDLLTLKDVEDFHHHLKAQGLKTNTRRRKLMTVKKFLNYLVGRNKLPVELGKKLPTPYKVERIPVTVSSDKLVLAIRNLPEATALDARNKALLWVLAETGCLVSELTRVRFDQWSRSAAGAAVRFEGKGERSVPVSSELFDLIQRLRKTAGDSAWIFFGFNKHGSLGAPITARGIELLVKAYAPRLEVSEVTPRTFRHSAVIRWFVEGASKEEIQKRLGLKTAYAFRSYEPILRSMTRPTSNSGTNPQES